MNEGAREEAALLLTYGELVDAAVCEGFEAEGFEGNLDLVLVGLGGAFEPAQVDVSAREDEFVEGDGEGPVDFTALGEVGDLVLASAYGMAKDADGALNRRDNADEGFEECRFSGTIGAEEGDFMASADSKVDGFEGVAFAIGV